MLAWLASGTAASGGRHAANFCERQRTALVTVEFAKATARCVAFTQLG